MGCQPCCDGCYAASASHGLAHASVVPTGVAADYMRAGTGIAAIKDDDARTILRRIVDEVGTDGIESMPVVDALSKKQKMW